LNVFDPSLHAARLSLGLSPIELWTRYITLGGNLDLTSTDAYLNGLVDVEDIDHDILTHALNESYSDRGENRSLAYRRP